ncbi:HHL096Wp [Eremothecium sinecaudum]|uniref:HHL096Wp n=1 Tax=Eremothecium sinecaudum TaxID=45286 RepID=A0A0X8HWE4_9SACH|nr:HHL096Wp [Eremothecium sinecaudum]AMD22674.1 HHL096Wp [Eremothecium sinecaudum]
MGDKRSRSDDKRSGKKKFKVVSNTLDPNTSGIYATCTRRHEKQAAQEFMILLQEKVEEYYVDELKSSSNEDSNNHKINSEDELSIEDQIKKELDDLKQNKSMVDPKHNKPLIKQIQLECECMVFFKVRKPIEPESFTLRLMEELANPEDLNKKTRYLQKLTPITSSCNATLEELTKLCQRVLPSHFHQDKTKSYKFAIEVTKRNFNTIDKLDIIKLVAREVGKSGEFAHTVDLKNYDKLVLVQCFKNNIGMSVVDANYRTKFRKYNIQELYESKFKKEENSPQKE